MTWKEGFGKFWHFIWEEDSLASWLANIVIAFVLIKFIVYPGIGFVFGTTHPIVAVVSGSMEHRGLGFVNWWETGECNGAPRLPPSELYKQYHVTKEGFEEYWFNNGFNTGDLMILFGDGEPQIGEVVVFFSPDGQPIIHRVIEIKTDGSLHTKGDNNCGSLPFEESINGNILIGKAVLRIPLLGWVKIGFLKILDLVGILQYTPFLR